jgi:hypothetical protein
LAQPDHKIGQSEEDAEQFGDADDAVIGRIAWEAVSRADVAATLSLEECCIDLG